MKKLIRVLIFVVLASAAWGQVFQGTFPTTNTITASGSSCTTYNNNAGVCDVAQLPPGTATSASITLSGTWAATIQFEQSADFQNTWTAVNCIPQPPAAAVSSATANGTWVCPTSAMSHLRARASAYTSGVANALIFPAIAGGGTVGANSGVAGSIPNYPAGGGSTLLAPDPFFSSNNAGILSLGGAGAANNGAISYFGQTSGSISVGCSNATCTQWGGNFVINVGKVTTSGNCGANGTAANPSVASCTAASTGTVSCNVAASAGTCTINTTQTTANSVISITPGNFGTGGTGRLAGVTCNVATLTGAFVSAIAAGTSFTITLPTFTTNPLCFTYVIND